MSAESSEKPRTTSSPPGTKEANANMVVQHGMHILDAAPALPESPADANLRLRKQIMAAYRKGNYYPDLTKDRWENHPNRAGFEAFVQAGFNKFVKINSVTGWCYLKNNTGETRAFMLVVSPSAYKGKNQKESSAMAARTPSPPKEGSDKNPRDSSKPVAEQKQKKSPRIPLTDQVHEWDNRVADMQPADKAELFFSLQKNVKTDSIIFNEDFYALLREQMDKFLDSTHFQGDRNAFYQSVLDATKSEKETELAMHRDRGEDNAKPAEVEKIMESEPNVQEKKG